MRHEAITQQKLIESGLYPTDEFSKGFNLCIGIGPLGAVFSTPGFIQSFCYRKSTANAEGTTTISDVPTFGGVDLYPFFSRMGQINKIGIYELASDSNDFFRRIHNNRYEAFATNWVQLRIRREIWGNNFKYMVPALAQARMTGELRGEFSHTPKETSLEVEQLLFPPVFDSKGNIFVASTTYEMRDGLIVPVHTTPIDGVSPYQGTLIHVNEN